MINKTLDRAAAASTTFGLWLRAAAEKHYTSVGVIVMALIGVGLGLALTLDARGAMRSPSLQAAFDLARPEAWGILCFAIALYLVIYGLASFWDTAQLKKVAPALFIAGTLLCFFAILVADTIPVGGGIYLGVVLFAGLGSVYYFIALGAYFAARR